jgi:hypothetical protein
MVATRRDAFVIAVADVFISSFNDNGANKQSQIKINFVATLLREADWPKAFLGYDAAPWLQRAGNLGSL